ncbi:MAG: hypothetical protein IJE43_03155 [Alphaproteobacteria bacterium]|nr:hypothetical protein [Alphaproteobacteria bacterium]
MFRVFTFNVPFTEKCLIIKTNEEIKNIKREIIVKMIEWEDIVKQLKILNKYTFAKCKIKLHGKAYSKEELELLYRRCLGSPVVYVVNSLFCNHEEIFVKVIDRTDDFNMLLDKIKR